jgi:tetratricopeptide (TPR) repeat protein
MHGEYKKQFGRPLAPQNPYYRMLLQLGPAVAQRGQAAEGKAFVEEALGVARRAESKEYVGRALVALAGIEPERARAYCEEAKRVAPLTPQIWQTCGGATRPEGVAALRAQILAKGEALRRDPDRFQAARRMAGLHQQLGRLLSEQGKEAEARGEWERARGYLEELVKRDPGSEAVAEQLKRVRDALEK